MHSKIIEIIGPPGIGKSTVYKALCEVWRPSSNWIYPEALLSGKPPSITNLSKWIEFQAKKVLKRKVKKNISQDLGLNFINNHPGLANFYWSHLNGDNMFCHTEIDKRFRSSYLLFSDFCTYQAIADTPCNTPCLLNEGLLQKSFLIHENQVYLTRLIESYFELIPLPRAIIYINSPNKNIIIQRLKNRPKVIATHQGKDDVQLLYDIELWQSYLNIVSEKAIDLNIPVLKVNGECAVSENVESLQQQLQQLD